MTIPPFKLERYYALYEFKASIMLSSSDCESLSMTEVLDMASPRNLDIWKNLRLGYTETQGSPMLREEIARKYRNIHPENIMVAAPEELIFIAMQTLLQAGDHIVAVAPAYQSLYEIAASNGCSLSFWRLKPTRTGWTADPDELETLITPHTRMLVMNFPNNPTGYLPTREQFDAILKIVQKHGILLFTDEMYRLLEYDPADQLLAVCDVYEKGISLAGLSKSMALPGLRIGWLATQYTELMEHWLAYKDYTTICNSAPSEILALIALQNQASIVKHNLEIIRSNIQGAADVFTRYRHLINWLPPRAGSIAFPQWKGKMSVEELCQQMLERYSVMLAPGSLFDHTGNHFRLGLGRKNFSAGISHLEQLMSECD